MQVTYTTSHKDMCKTYNENCHQRFITFINKNGSVNQRNLLPVLKKLISSLSKSILNKKNFVNHELDKAIIRL